MCGISGYIGKPKNQKITYELITQIFESLHTRGIDASGYWGTVCGQDETVYHKSPMPSNIFIKTSNWRSLKAQQLDLLLIHARATSVNGGSSLQNVNNHPFVSTNRHTAMVHNGSLVDIRWLENCYPLSSQTDSELILRIYEKEMSDSESLIESRLNGVHGIWSRLTEGAMAVAIGEKLDDDKRLLVLFRNEKRPLWLVDLKKQLGQIFFFSCPEIWLSAIRTNRNLFKITQGAVLVPLPAQHISIIETDSLGAVKTMSKFRVHTSI